MDWQRRTKTYGLLLALTLLASVQQAPGQDDVPVLPDTVVEGTQPAFQPIIGAGSVFGGDVGNVFNVPGSGTFLDQSDIRDQSYGNVERVLRKAPGVYLRAEDGYGNFPNISLRGSDTTRSAKVTIMEDGVLTAPAPYAAPSAYYFPNVARMSGVEVIKGHSQILFGPHTTGGAINFLSTQIPEDASVFLRTEFGSYNEMRIHLWTGGTRIGPDGSRWGFVAEGYFREADGFRTIDNTPDFRPPDTNDTGFSRREPMVKFFFEPATNVYTRWETKFGYTDFEANETYLGLSETDVRATPLRRYAASRFDNIDTNHDRSYLRFTIGDPESDWLSITSTIYYNKFARNWFKLHDIRNISGGPAQMSLSAALAGASGNTGLDVLQGTRAGTLRVRNNNRSYYAWGYESVASMFFAGLYCDHDVTIGFRHHHDQVRRFQNNEDFTQTANGTISAQTIGAPGTAGNRKQWVEANAFWVQDAIQIGALTITPGFRYEHLTMAALDFQSPSNPARNGNAQLGLEGGGVGVTYELSDRVNIIGGFHRGFTPPSPRGRLGGLKEEISYASEGGFRYMNRERAFAMQAIGFYTHFQNLLVIDNIGGTGTGDDENVGAVYAGGIEFSMEYDMGTDRGWGFRNPWFAVLTYTDAKVLGGAASADPESLFAGAVAGAQVPYIPEITATFGTGIHFDTVGVDVSCIYSDETFSTASNTTTQINPVNGNPDARFGMTDSFFLVDIAGYVVLTENWRLFGGVQNVANQNYIISRHPHGPRSGAPIFGYSGIQAIY